MKQRRKGKEKLPLIFSTALSILAVFVGSVSTFAWFQAVANARIQTTSQSTTITVTKPDDLGYTYYTYNGNGEHGYLTKDDDFANFNAAFTEQQDLNPEIAVSGLWPGYRLTFCLMVETSYEFSLVLPYEEVNIGKLADTVGYRYIYNNTTTTYDIDMGRAIRIYADVLDSNNKDDYENFLDGNDTESEPLENMFNYSKLSEGNISLSHEDSVLAHHEAVADSTYFVFCTIEFSNESTTYYQEVDSTGKTLDAPVADSLEHPRYFKYSSSGNSNCYIGLSFAIGALLLG